MSTWSERAEPEFAPIGAAGWLRALVRGVPLGTLVFGCLIALLLLRLIERPLFGVRRPWTPQITRFVCRNAFRLLGIGYTVTGTPIKQAGALVSNHVSWLDIFALNAPLPLYFVSKAEVAGWPGIGWLAKATGTVFIERKRAEAPAQVGIFAARLAAGHRLLFFPEGTSTDGQQVLAFKAPLFQPFADGAGPDLWVQPVTLNYTAPVGQDARFYGWWGGMSFGGHLLQTLAASRQGSVEVTFHPPLNKHDFEGRKEIAKACERAVRGGLKVAGGVKTLP